MSYISDLDVGPFLDKFSEPEYAAAFWTLVVTWAVYAVTKYIGGWAWGHMKTLVVGKEEPAPDPKKLDARLRQVGTDVERNWNSIVDHIGKHGQMETDSAGRDARLSQRLDTVEKTVGKFGLADLKKQSDSLAVAHLTINELSCQVRDLMDAATKFEDIVDEDDAVPDLPPPLSPLAVALIDQINKAKLATWKVSEGGADVTGMVTPNGLRVTISEYGNDKVVYIRDAQGKYLTDLLLKSDIDTLTSVVTDKQFSLRSIEMDRQRAEAVAALTLPPVPLGPVPAPTPYHPGKTILPGSKGFEAVVDDIHYALPMPQCVPPKTPHCDRWDKLEDKKA